MAAILGPSNSVPHSLIPSLASSPSLSGADIRSVCTEAGMFAIRARRKVSCEASVTLYIGYNLSTFQVATEKDFIDAVNKVIKAYAKFSSTPRYMTYN